MQRDIKEATRIFQIKACYRVTKHGVVEGLVGLGERLKSFGVHAVAHASSGCTQEIALPVGLASSLENHKLQSHYNIKH